ncbi:MAG: hypothetical protein WC710_14190 [Gallionella sp.]
MSVLVTEENVKKWREYYADDDKLEMGVDYFVLACLDTIDALRAELSAALKRSDEMSAQDTADYIAISAELEKEKTATSNAENNVIAITNRLVAFAGQLQAWGVDGAARNILTEILGGEVNAPDYYALRAELAACQAERDALAHKLDGYQILIAHHKAHHEYFDALPTPPEVP